MDTPNEDAVVASSEAGALSASSLQTALDTLSGAVLEGTDSVTALALDLVRTSTGAVTAAVLRRTQGEWVPQSALSSDSSQLLESGIEDLLKDDSRLSCGSYGCFVPLSPGTESIFLPRFSPGLTTGAPASPGFSFYPGIICGQPGTGSRGRAGRDQRVAECRARDALRTRAQPGIVVRDARDAPAPFVKHLRRVSQRGRRGRDAQLRG